MEKQQPLHVQFFEEYVQLLRMRLEHYHSNNGGAAKFVNNLIITPQTLEDSYRHEIRDAWSNLNCLNEYLYENTPVHTEVTGVFFEDNEFNLAYNLMIFIETKCDTLDEIEYIDFVIGKKGIDDIFCINDRDILTKISDEVWRDLISNVQGAISFGTLCMA